MTDPYAETDDWIVPATQPRDFDCPTCGAVPNEFCRDGTGSPMQVDHLLRPGRPSPNVPASSGARLARYAEVAEAIGTYLMGAMAEATVGVRDVDGWEKVAAREAASQWLVPLVDRETAELRAEVERLRQGLWDTWAAIGHDTDGDDGPQHWIAGMGVDSFISTVVRDAAAWRQQSEEDYDADTESLTARAEAAEAESARLASEQRELAAQVAGLRSVVAKVEALVDSWPAYRTDDRSDYGRAVAQCRNALRAAVEGGED
jgi:hypothetical protein